MVDRPLRPVSNFEDDLDSAPRLQLSLAKSGKIQLRHLPLSARAAPPNFSEMPSFVCLRVCLSPGLVMVLVLTGDGDGSVSVGLGMVGVGCPGRTWFERGTRNGGMRMLCSYVSNQERG